MHKRTILVLAVLLAAAALGFASGQSESPAGFDGKPISLEGEIRFQDRSWPELETSAGTYLLMVPRYLPAGVEIAEGDRISVEGFEVPGPHMGWQKSDEKYLAVTKAVIGGEEYLVNHAHGQEGLPCFDDEGWGPHHGHRGHGQRGMPSRGGPGSGWSQS